jgi:hypothetical protein
MTVEEFKIQYALGSLSDEDMVEFVRDPNTSIEIIRIMIAYNLNNFEE